MTYFDSRKKAEDYIKMAEGYDGAKMIVRLREHLPAGAKVMELGMGPGTDLLDLASTYEVVGTDVSPQFLEIFQEKHPEIKLARLDVVTIEIDEMFDGIYSNKVLHYLDKEALEKSFLRQAELLNDKGFVLHSFWRGEQIEEFDGEKHYYYMEDDVIELVKKVFDVIYLECYEEFSKDDSFFILLQKK